MKHLRIIVVLLFVLFVIVVAVQNYKAFSTTVKFKMDLVFVNYESADMSLYYVSVITFLIGIVVAGLYGMAERFRLKKQMKFLKRTVKEQEKELNSLRNLPVTAEDIRPDKVHEQP